MKKLFITILGAVFISSYLFAQSTDSAFVTKINVLQAKISKIKEMPKEEQKKHAVVLSDVENRKNTLKSLLKTPSGKRDNAWTISWNENYEKALSKLANIQ